MFDDGNSFTSGCGSLMGLFGPESVDQMVRSTTFGMFGATASFVPKDFVWDFPYNSLDRAQGGICTATNFKAPGHSMVTVDGLMFIDDFAPDRVAK